MNLKIDHNSPVPLHAQVEDLLRDLIKKPEYKKGDKLLPKEVELAKRFGISRNTVRKAVTKLVHEGKLERKRGVGTKVKDNEIVTSLSDWHSFTQEMNEKGIPFENLQIDTKWIEANRKIAGKLNIQPGTKILKLIRLRGDKNREPVVQFISYFHPRVGLTGKEDFTKPLYDILEQDYSVIPTSSKEKIEAISAGKELSELLDIDPGNPILFRRRTVCDPGGRIIEYNLCYYRADKFTYSITIKR